MMGSYAGPTGSLIGTVLGRPRPLPRAGAHPRPLTTGEVALPLSGASLERVLTITKPLDIVGARR